MKRFISSAVVMAVLVACGETGPSEQLPPAAVTNVTGVPLTGPAGEALAERVVVRVGDAAGNPLPGVSVTFVAAGTGASVEPANAVTDDLGEARTRWTLARTAGQQTLTVTAGGTSLQVIATAGPPRVASLAVNAGNNQTGTLGSPLPVNPSIIARDALGAPVEGVTVSFSILSGGGSVSPTGVTNAQGIATPGQWTLGAIVGTQLLSAQVSQNGVANNPLIFSATAASGAPASVIAFSPTQQTAQVGSLVANPPSVVVRDAGSNPVPNVTVTFAITSGAGQLTGVTQTTNTLGIASATSWRLGAAPGTNTVTASVSGFAPVTFTATGVAGAPAQLLKSAGDNQTGTVNRPLPVAPQVRVTDAAGNGVSGVAVVFGVALGGGSAVVADAVTGPDGRASVGAWIMGPTPGENRLTAAVAGLPTVTFTATAQGGVAVSMQPASLVTQSGVAGQAASSLPSVVVRDALGNPSAGVTVNFAVTAGGGVLVGTTRVTDISGTATVTSWTLGSVAGLNTVVASSTGLASVTFNATTTGLPAFVVALGGDNQAAVQGTDVQIPPSVRVTDVNGQGAGGVVVNFVSTSGGGFVSGASQVTDAAGVATVGSWTLGAGANNQLTATVSATGVTGNPVVFSASAATQIAITQQPPTNSASGANFTVSVQLRDAGGVLSPVSGVPLVISIASGAGNLTSGGTGLAVVTAAGTASFNVNITGVNGARTLRISGAGLGNVVTTTINIP
jgi:adhesin/invasin